MRSTFRRISLAAALGVALGVTAACSRAGRAGSNEAAEPATAPAVVTFANQSLEQARVYAIRSSGDMRRLGIVDPGQTETLRLPRDLAYGAGPVTIIAVPLASNRVASSGPISISPGTRLAITLPATQNSLMVLPAPPK